MKKHESKQPDLYQKVTNRIIELLESGVIPWRKTWNSYGLAKNYATNHTYTGINCLLMNNTAHPIPYFLTFKQAKKMGGSIKKGAKSEQVIFFKILFKDAKNKTISKDIFNQKSKQGEEVKVLKFLRYYNVFNVKDVKDIELELPILEQHEHKKIKACEQIINKMKQPPSLISKDPNRAYYVPKDDALNMPNINQFAKAADFYAVIFHEMIHATGHKKRLAREGIMNFDRFGSTQYSKEELIAEIGASFLCAKAGITNDDIMENAAAYIQGWLGKLREDNKFIFKSAAEAQKAANYILG